MDVFFREMMSTARLVIVGRSQAIVDRLIKTPLGLLLAWEVLLGVVLGLLSFDLRRLIGYPILLSGLTVLWALLFALVSELRREQMHDLYALFLGSSLFLLPAVVPLVGPFILQGLIIGWPFLLARLLASHLCWKPGKVFVNLILPPLILCATLQGILWIVGRAFLSVNLS